MAHNQGILEAVYEMSERYMGQLVSSSALILLFCLGSPLGIQLQQSASVSSRDVDRLRRGFKYLREFLSSGSWPVLPLPHRAHETS